MKAGNYGKLNLYASREDNLTNNSSITFVSEQPHKAVVTGLEAIGVENVTFDGIKFDYTSQKGATLSTKWARIEQSENIVVKNSVFDGDHASGVGNTQNGYGTGNGLFVRGSENVEVYDNEFYNFYRGAVFQRVDDLLVKDNELYDMSSDGFNFAAVTDVLIEGNYIHDFDAHVNTPAHKDFIQFWNNGETEPSTDVILRGNVLDSGAGVFAQSLYLGNTEIPGGAGKNHPLLYQNFLIEDNVIRNAHKIGISVQFVDGITIKNNTVLQNLDSAPDPLLPVYIPVIDINGSVFNAKVIDNVAHEIEGSSYQGSGNLIVQRDRLGADNHYEDLFVNALSDGAGTWEDLYALPGSVIDNKNIGSKLLQFDTTPNSTEALLLSDYGDGLAMNQHAFDISNVYGPKGKISTNNASVQWDFGDGKSGSGLTTTHSYSKPGTYEVSATIRLSNGEKIIANKTLEVQTPVAIAVDFQKGDDDISGLVNAERTDGNVQIVTDSGSKVAKLNGNSIRYTRSDELFDNEEYTLLVDFKKDNLGDYGKIIDFVGTFTVNVKANALSVTAQTSKGTEKFTPGGVGLNDTAWHRLALTFDSDSGQITLYLDGKQIAQDSGHKGAIQKGNLTHDFHIGSPFGGSFNGLVDNVYFLKGALSSNEVKNLHSGSKDLDDILGSASISAPSASTSGAAASSSTATVESNTSSNNDTSNNTSNTSNSSNNDDPDTGSKSGGVTRYYVGDKNDSVLINAKVTEDDLEILTKHDQIRINTDRDALDEHVIKFANNLNINDFELEAAGNKTLLSYEGSTSSSSSSTTTSSSSSNTTSNTNSSSDVDTGSTSGGVTRYYVGNKNDSVLINAKVTEDDLEVLTKHDQIRINTDRDALDEHVIKFANNLNITDFELTASGNKTLLSYEGSASSSSSNTSSSNAASSSTATKSVDFSAPSLPFLNEGRKVANSKINGIADEDYLDGDLSRDFTIKIDGSNTHHTNSLGVYEYNDSGRITDVRIIDPNVTNNGKNATFDVRIDKNDNLGFFVVKDGADKVAWKTLNSNKLDLDIGNDGKVTLTENGKAVKDAEIYVSHDKSLNADNQEHVLSGTDKDYDGYLAIAFEDTNRNWKNGDEDFNDLIVYVQSDNFDFA